MKSVTFTKHLVLMVLVLFMMNGLTIQAMKKGLEPVRKRKRDLKKYRKKKPIVKGKSADLVGGKKRKKIGPKRHCSNGVIRTPHGREYHQALSGSRELLLASTWEEFVKSLEGKPVSSVENKQKQPEATTILKKIPDWLRLFLTTSYKTTKQLENNINQLVSENNNKKKEFTIELILKSLQYALIEKKEALFVALSKIIPSMSTLALIEHKMPEEYALPKVFEVLDYENPAAIPVLYAQAINEKKENKTIQALEKKYRNKARRRYMSKLKPLCKDIVSFGVTTGQFYLVLVFINKLEKRGFSVGFLDELPKKLFTKLQNFVKSIFDLISEHNATVMLSMCIGEMPSWYLKKARDLTSFPEDTNCGQFLNESLGYSILSNPIVERCKKKQEENIRELAARTSKLAIKDNSMMDDLNTWLTGELSVGEWCKLLKTRYILKKIQPSMLLKQFFIPQSSSSKSVAEILFQQLVDTKNFDEFYEILLVLKNTYQLRKEPQSLLLPRPAVEKIKNNNGETLFLVLVKHFKKLKWQFSIQAKLVCKHLLNVILTPDELRKLRQHKTEDTQMTAYNYLEYDFEDEAIIPKNVLNLFKPPQRF